ncbi:hypothetical protein OM427_31000 [Halomonas sp. 18H]|uniref:hypothetical protein n=1 Tax=Halomonas almeriensis TaxID=308163 RepID=UPI0022323F0C|nr:MULTISPECIES: hypothetical protein [Halomonas]MCW4153928.1 hypothetical protein [Halomonas sp. 18H]MDN3554260.1 hypothetical protein [Halomonas almeriensis]
MKIKKAWVHIGMEKTGTTSIQNFLGKNRERLADQGFYFMKSTGLANDVRLVGYCLDRNQTNYFLFRNEFVDSEEKKDAFDKEFLDSFEKEISELPSDVENVVFSSELFHSRLNKPHQRQKLRSFLENYFEDVAIVGYIRPQVDVNISLYSTSLKSGGVEVGLEEHLERCHVSNYFYNYFEFLSGWEKSFSGCSFIVNLFDRKELTGGDVVSDFCSVCGVDPTNLASAEQENESVTATGQEMLKAINRNLPVFLEGAGLNYIRSNFVNYISRIYAGSGEKPGKDLAYYTQMKFDSINEEVRRRWFPERTVLFDIDYEKYNGGASIDYSAVEFFEKLLVEVSKTSRAGLVGINSNKINGLRDAAIVLEEHDIKSALEVMQVASILRPEGQGIKRKLSDYREILHRENGKG